MVSVETPTDFTIAQSVNINRCFSRVNTSKDNSEPERFNQMLQYEWLYDGNLDLDCDRFNHHLTEWLIEYNFNRPHQKLRYSTPIEHIEKEIGQIRGPGKVLPMWSARTKGWNFPDFCVKASTVSKTNFI
ncbi:MAG: transposase [Deltaproteobacteria bacterium]|nr:MAG: transposase [Deltaproteobacteria bacterium]